jgi:hypothetical protein
MRKVQTVDVRAIPKPPRSLLTAVHAHVTSNYIGILGIAALAFAAYTYSLIPELVRIANDNKETVYVNDLRGHVETTITDKTRPPQLWRDTVDAELADWAIKATGKVRYSIQEHRELAALWLRPADQSDFLATAAADIAGLPAGGTELVAEPHHVVHHNSFTEAFARTPNTVFHSQIYLSLKERSPAGIKESKDMRLVTARWQFLTPTQVKARRASYGLTYANDDPLGIEILDYSVRDLPKQ